MTATHPSDHLARRYYESEELKRQAQTLADAIDCTIYLFANRAMAAQGSDLAAEYINAGQRLIYVARPKLR